MIAKLLLNAVFCDFITFIIYLQYIFSKNLKTKLKQLVDNVYYLNGRQISSTFARQIFNRVKKF